jgi:myo-inositol-1(or 4)-monophosphatase
MTDSSASPILDVAVEIAREAGDMLLAKRPHRPEVVQTKSSPTDVVTALDREAERLIRDRIHAARPGDAILGEEGGQTPGSAEGRRRWIVDPIDGTVNFLYGLPDWSVSIAVEETVGETRRIVAGAVFVVPRGELFAAARGGGAYLYRDGAAPERLSCNTGVALPAALVATGFGYESGFRAEQARVLAEVLPRVRDIRRGGSAAADLCSVAAGRVDAYYERGPKLWDYAAGGLVATEAGARLRGIGDAPGADLILCASPGLFEELDGLLATLGRAPGGRP